MKRVWVYSSLFAFGIAAGIAACKHKGSASASKNEVNPEAVLFDLNDVSILFPYRTELANKGNYILLSTATSEGPVMTEGMFQQVNGLLKSSKLPNYDSFALAALRIDECAKLVAQLPCQAQIRLVFQPLLGDDPASSPTDLKFEDHAMHLAYDIEESSAKQMYQDFLDLKKSALPTSTVGPLGLHPVLAKEGMGGPFAKNLNAIILKYALPSRFERIAVMGLGGSPGKFNGSFFEPGTTIWEFAATLPIKDGKILPTPIPCQKPSETTNTFSITSEFGLSGGIVKEEFTGCDDLNFNGMVGQVGLSENKKEIDAAIKTSNPDLVFFGSTTCVNCHVASRRLDGDDPKGPSVADDGNPLRFKRPSDVSNTKDEKTGGDNKNVWGFRAFGWGQHFDRNGIPGITTYTLHDTMRVAHGLNELIRKGELN